MGSHSPGYPAGNDAALGRFARLVIERQPWTYASLIAKGTAHFFVPGRPTWQWDGCLGCWDFPPAPEVHNCGYPMTGTDLQGRTVGCSADTTPARLLKRYAYVGYATGPALAASLVGGVVLMIRRRRGTDRFWHAPAMCFTTAIVLIVFAVATSAFDYRHGLPGLVLLPVGAALTLASIGASRDTVASRW